MLFGVQDEVVAYLKSEAGFQADSRADVIVTHISIVVLAGSRAFKLKRAVCLPYVDFSTPERRLVACEQELLLNRRTAPSLYLAVRRITREQDGRLALDGKGPLVDAVVEMARFDEAGLFDRMAVAGSLTPALMTRLAHRIATFHAEAAIERGRTGAAGMAAVLVINEQALTTSGVFPQREVVSLNAASRDALTEHRSLLDARARAGKVRRCHGDLHLRNICLVGGEPTLFDCLEFDEGLATTDVLYDLAFVLMDLWHRRLGAAANILFNRYLDAADEEDGLRLLPFFMAVRAAVRAHVTAAQVADAGEGMAERRIEARSYFDLARSLLVPKPARLVAVGGFSGSGKSTVAAAIAPEIGPAPGARILASDRIRKHLFGASAETRLPARAYRPEISRRVYELIAVRAGHILRRGHGVVADAVFDRPDERGRIADVALREGVAFQGLWLEAGTELLVERVAARRGDPSDATPDVVRDQVGRPLGAIDWSRLPTDAGAEDVFLSAKRLIGAGDAPASDALRPQTVEDVSRSGSTGACAA
jgi:hypothetical protein